jgi:hypothetical protein
MDEFGGPVLGADDVAYTLASYCDLLCEDFERAVNAMDTVTPGALVELMDNFLLRLTESIPNSPPFQTICDRTLVTNSVSLVYLVGVDLCAHAHATREKDEQTIYLESGNYFMRVKLRHYLIPCTYDV